MKKKFNLESIGKNYAMEINEKPPRYRVDTTGAGV